MNVSKCSFCALRCYYYGTTTTRGVARRNMLLRAQLPYGYLRMTGRSAYVLIVPPSGHVASRAATPRHPTCLHAPGCVCVRVSVSLCWARVGPNVASGSVLRQCALAARNLA